MKLDKTYSAKNEIEIRYEFPEKYLTSQGIRT